MNFLNARDRKGEYYINELVNIDFIGVLIFYCFVFVWIIYLFEFIWQFKNAIVLSNAITS